MKHDFAGDQPDGAGFDSAGLENTKDHGEEIVRIFHDVVQAVLLFAVNFPQHTLTHHPRMTYYEADRGSEFVRHDIQKLGLRPFFTFRSCARLFEFRRFFKLTRWLASVAGRTGREIGNQDQIRDIVIVESARVARIKADYADDSVPGKQWNSQVTSQAMFPEEWGIHGTRVVLEIHESYRFFIFYDHLAQAQTASGSRFAPVILIEVVARDGVKIARGLVAQPKSDRFHRRYLSGCFEQPARNGIVILVR